MMQIRGARTPFTSVLATLASHSLVTSNKKRDLPRYVLWYGFTLLNRSRNAHFIYHLAAGSSAERSLPLRSDTV